MKKIKFGALFLCAAILVTVLTGCGESKRLTQDEYVEVMTEFSDDLMAIDGNGVDYTKPETIKSFVDTYKSAVDKFAKNNPPEELQEAHDAMVAGCNELADALDILNTVSTSTSAEEITNSYADFMAKSQSAVTKVTEAMELYKDAGLDESLFEAMGGLV